MHTSLPLGKLPPDLLAALLARNRLRDPRVILGPRVGEDAAVIDLGAQYLIAKTDPITFATSEIGWYAVNVNANDIATMGGVPSWFMATLLLPQGQTDTGQVAAIFDQIYRACDDLGITLIGGHSEITFGIDRPIVVGMMLGLAERNCVVLTGNAQPGDQLLVTKGVPIEATAIIARERRSALQSVFPDDFILRCANFLQTPGISVVRDAQIATGAGRVSAMHDPTEGGLSTALWELAEASGRRLVVDPAPAVLPEGAALCAAVGIDPLGAIASGALLIAAAPPEAEPIRAALAAEGIAAFAIGHVEQGPADVIDTGGGQPRRLMRPLRDEIARLFE